MSEDSNISLPNNCLPAQTTEHNTNINPTSSTKTYTYTDPHTSQSYEVAITEDHTDHPVIHIASPQQDTLQLRLTDTPARETETSDCPSDEITTNQGV